MVKAELRRFGYVVGTVFLALALYQAYRHRFTWMFYGLGGAGSLLVVLGLVAPALLAPIRRVWMTLASILGFINTRILLAVIFLVFFTPIALVLRMLGRDLLDRRIENTPSFWKPRPRTPFDKDSYRRQF